MKCINPRTIGVYTYGCGQCNPCRFNKRRVWTHRILLEALCHSASSFVTLTYTDENLPVDRSVSGRAIQLFMKRLRKAYGKPLRYFAVGEYGDETERPHYHLALFGIGTGSLGRVRNHGISYVTDPLVDRCWSLGKTDVKELVPETAAYLCGYVVKKLSSPTDPRLGGRAPEFARMSRRPGIGAYAMASIAESFRKSGVEIVEGLEDVPSVLRHGDRIYPLGTYLKKKLREQMEFTVLGSQKEVDLALSEKLLSVYLDYVETQEEEKTVKQHYMEVNKQRFRNENNRSRIFSRQRTL